MSINVRKEVEMEEPHLSLSEAAHRLDISERTARRWIKSGKLRAYKPGRDYWIPESAIKEVVVTSQVRPKVEAPSSQQLTLNGLLAEERRHPTDSEIRSLGRWLTYLEWRLNESDLTLAELSHELDAAGGMGIRHAPAEYPDEIFNQFMRLVRRTLQEAKSFAALQTEAAELATDMDRLEEVHAQAQYR
jgi:excisionase family DNA binding protein